MTADPYTIIEGRDGTFTVCDVGVPLRYIAVLGEHDSGAVGAWLLYVDDPSRAVDESLMVEAVMYGAKLRLREARGFFPGMFEEGDYR